MKNQTEAAVEVAARKAKTLEVLFDDPNIAQALARVNVFLVDHEPNGRRSKSLMPREGHDNPSSSDAYEWLDYIHAEDREQVRQAWEAVVRGDEDVFEAVYRFQVDDGQYRWISNIGTMVYRLEEGQPGLYIGADCDITEARRLQQLLEQERSRLAQMVINDEFLNIPNRRFLDTRQQQFFTTDGQTPVAVLVLDVDNFKQLNTQLTHKGGDDVLQKIVAQIQSCLRPEDVLARYGGDEFVLVLPNVTTEYAHKTAQTMLGRVMAMTLPYAPDLTLSISIGLYHGYPGATENFWDYFEVADRLLLAAKQHGKARIHSAVAKTDSVPTE